MPPSSVPLPYEMGRYVLTERLGAGGMAEVFLAEHRGVGDFKKRLAVKRILPHLAERQHFVEMFFREAQLASRINHPNVVQIFELGEHDGTYFLAMEHVDGVSLRDLAREAEKQGAEVPLAVWVRAIADGAAGLHAAHTLEADDGTPLEIVHRDISPDNLMISKSGVTKILDFGVAKALATDDTLTESGEIKGKLPYMAPEQIEDRPLDGRADLYALGISLFWLLTGQGPFHRSSQVATMKAVLEDEPPSLALLRPDVPDQLEWIIGQLLHKDREQRPSNGDAVRQMLLNAVPEARTPDYGVVRELISERRRRHLAAVSDPTLPQMKSAPAIVEQTAVTETSGTVVEWEDRRRSLRFAGLAIAAAVTLLLGAVFVVATGDESVPELGAEGGTDESLAATTEPAPSPPPPVEPPAAETPEPEAEAEPDDGPRAPAAAKRARARRISVKVTAPAGTSWRDARGRKLSVSGGAVRVARGTTSLVATDPRTSGRVTVPVKNGVASLDAVASGNVSFLVQPFGTVWVGKKKLGMTPLDGPVALPAGRYTARVVGELKTVKKAFEVTANKRTTVRVNLAE